MKLYIASDLHVEFHKDKKQYIDRIFGDDDPESIVVLAGDIDVGRTNLKHTLAQIAEKFKYAVYVPGNHEYYNGLGYGELREVVPKLPKNVLYLAHF
jgi:predicted phosphohydrolase